MCAQLPGLLTRIIKAMVRPRKMSSETRRPAAAASAEATAEVAAGSTRAAAAFPATDDSMGSFEAMGGLRVRGYYSGGSAPAIKVRGRHPSHELRVRSEEHTSELQSPTN